MKTARLVDTSVWIAHLRSPQPELIRLLTAHQVLVHSAVIGELACGNLPNRSVFIQDLVLLPKAIEASAHETLELIERRRLYGKGLGWVDLQLLASASLSNAELLTYDKTLARFS